MTLDEIRKVGERIGIKGLDGYGYHIWLPALVNAAIAADRAQADALMRDRIDAYLKGRT